MKRPAPLLIALVTLAIASAAPAQSVLGVRYEDSPGTGIAAPGTGDGGPDTRPARVNIKLRVRSDGDLDLLRTWTGVGTGSGVFKVFADAKARLDAAMTRLGTFSPVGAIEVEPGVVVKPRAHEGHYTEAGPRPGTYHKRIDLWVDAQMQYEVTGPPGSTSALIAFLEAYVISRRIDPGPGLDTSGRSPGGGGDCHRRPGAEEMRDLAKRASRALPLAKGVTSAPC